PVCSLSASVQPPTRMTSSRRSVRYASSVISDRSSVELLTPLVSRRRLERASRSSSPIVGLCWGSRSKSSPSDGSEKRSTTLSEFEAIAFQFYTVTCIKESNWRAQQRHDLRVHSRSPMIVSPAVVRDVARASHPLSTPRLLRRWFPWLLHPTRRFPSSAALDWPTPSGRMLSRQLMPPASSRSLARYRAARSSSTRTPPGRR